MKPNPHIKASDFKLPEMRVIKLGLSGVLDDPGWSHR
jgi:hypothetical protein